MLPIPAVWRIDIEPDDFKPGPGQPPWNGFATMVGLIRDLRRRVEDLAGAAVRPTWFIRFDPDIERAYGQADYVFDRYAALFDELRSAGDTFGIHVHYYRWDARREVTYSDHADPEWVAHCFNVAAKTFERCFGEPVRRASHGGFLLDDATAQRSVALGIEVDVTVEPGLGPLGENVSFGAYATAPSPDFRDFPRRPYYPAVTSLRVPATSLEAALPLMLVPLTAYDYDRALAPWHRRLAWRIRSRPERARPLNPWKEWPDPGVYWDLMERAADEGPARYVTLAVRTDSPSSWAFRQAQALFDHLPRHPIARRLRFVDPLSPEIRAMARLDMSTDTAI